MGHASQPARGGYKQCTTAKKKKDRIDKKKRKKISTEKTPDYEVDGW